jgi:hypothetical protein
MGLTNSNELAPKGLVTLVIYPRAAIAATPDPAVANTKWRLPWILSLFVFLLAAGFTFAAVYTHELWSGPVVSTPRFIRAVLPETGLGLRVEYESERLLVTWSRTSPAVRSAVQGVLRIEDGGQHRDVLMDATQVVAGSVLYKPASNDVTFRLEIKSDGRKPVVESIRVLDAGKPPPATGTTGAPAGPSTAVPNSGPAALARPAPTLAT